MKVKEVREKYLKFFEARGHKIINPAPLVLPDDPTTLFTSSGMQPLIPYLMGEPHPEGKRVCNSQPSIRTQDIEEVGDMSHTTFFEMLGNWSFGDYFKKEQLTWFWEFLTNNEEGLGLDPNRLYVTVFGGEDGYSVNGKLNQLKIDVESEAIWKELFEKEGVKVGSVDMSNGGEFDFNKTRIYYYGSNKNWWSRSGPPNKMPVGEIGGPDSEVFYDFGQDYGFHENSNWKDEQCHPNCECGRFLEIGNSVFMQYKKVGEKEFEELPNKNVDFGGGLERLTAVTIKSPDVFSIDVFESLIKKTEEFLEINYKGNEREIRIIADHIRAAIFLMKDGVLPSNKYQGYVLRRLLRRCATKAFKYNKDFGRNKFRLLARCVMDNYQDYFKGVNRDKIEDEISNEVGKFRVTLEKGLKEFDKFLTFKFGEAGNPETHKPYVYPGDAFKLFETYGFPIEVFIEVAREKGIMLGSSDLKDKDFIFEFQQEMIKHQEKSRTASAGKFKGGLADHSEQTTKLHTATHLLQAALRQVLGEHVTQKGSNITHERLRFDFNHDKALSDEEIKKVEELINLQIDQKLPVSQEVMDFKQVSESGALANFGERYGERVSVYSIGQFSKEVCGGPHVSNLSELGGHVKIIKEKSASSGIRRIYAVLEKI